LEAAKRPQGGDPYPQSSGSGPLEGEEAFPGRVRGGLEAFLVGRRYGMLSDH
jgi:hypothetical protein